MRQDKVVELAHGRRIVAEGERLWDWGIHVARDRITRRSEALTTLAHLGPGVRALEIGCGTGLVTQELVKSGADLTAIDLSPELIAIARQRVQAPHLRFDVVDVDAMPYPDGSFDCVVGCRVLHHLSLASVIREIWRVLRVGGRTVFAEPNMANPQLLIQKNVPLIKRWMGDTEDETAFFRWPLKRFLMEHGFEQVEITPFDFLHPWTPKRLIPFVKSLGEVLESVPIVREIAGSLCIVGVKGNTVA